MTKGAGRTVVAGGAVAEVLETVAEICGRYGISALEDLLESTRLFAQEKILNVAVFGRFNAGKSSFLNHLLNRDLLPVGAIPVTSAVTEIQWGPAGRAEIEYADGRREQVPVEAIGEFVTENRNPENRRQVARVLVELPEMERYRGIRFVDTPGLESVLEHNTHTSLDWLPNVGLALVAVSADPPLSRSDIELIRNLSRYTPNISLLLTKIDLLDQAERMQVLRFVQTQLARYWSGAVPVFPYSIRPGYDRLREELHSSLLAQVRANADERRTAILEHKLDLLMAECADYLNVALKAAEVADSDRNDLIQKILGQRESLDETRLALRLIVRHAAGSMRAAFEAALQAEEMPLRQTLQSELDREFPAWSGNLGVVTGTFDDWIRTRLCAAMAELSRKHHSEFIEPARRAGRQLAQSLQDFRNRLSGRMMENLGAPLRTTGMELRTEDPKSPDVRVGKIFDRNWELLSWLLPMSLVRGVLLRHFRRKVEDLVFINLSRLASQWETAVNASLLDLEKEAVQRLDGLIETVEKLIASTREQAPRIREDLLRVERLRSRFSGHRDCPAGRRKAPPVDGTPAPSSAAGVDGKNPAEDSERSSGRRPLET